MMNVKLFLGVMGCLSLGALTHCSSDDAEPSGDLGETFPIGLAVSSPTARQTSSGSSSLINAISIDPDASLEVKKDALSELASGLTECTFELPDFKANKVDPSCYGPKLFYQDHPDGSDFPPQGLDTEASLPTGDLGIWEETEGGTEACAAAKMNAEIENISSKVDMSLLFAANISCLINSDSSLSFPALGSTSDFTSQLSAAIATDNPGTTVNSASVEYVEDLDGFPVYLYSVDLTTGGSDVVIRLKHVKTNESGTAYRGKLWSSFNGGISGVGDSYAFSLLYDITETEMNYQMLGTNYNEASVSDPFDADDNVDVSSDWSGNFTQTIANFDPNTQTGSLSYAWQAGRGDDKSRVFNVYTENSGSSTFGYAFFGYGENFDSGSGTLSDNEIERFICNWAGPGNSHSVPAFVDYAQKQVMEVNSVGIFEPTTSNITYAPVNDCSVDGLTTLVISLDEGDINIASPVAITNDLVDLSGDADYAGYAAPTAPTDF